MIWKKELQPFQIQHVFLEWDFYSKQPLDIFPTWGEKGGSFGLTFSRHNPPWNWPWTWICNCLMLGKNCKTMQPQMAKCLVHEWIPWCQILSGKKYFLKKQIQVLFEGDFRYPSPPTRSIYLSSHLFESVLSPTCLANFKASPPRKMQSSVLSFRVTDLLKESSYYTLEN